MFTDFFYFLRLHGLKVSLLEWLSLMKALAQGYARADLMTFYRLARALLVKRETDFDLYDRIFAAYFRDIDGHFELDEELMKWLEDPQLPRTLSDDELAMLQSFDLDGLRKRFEQLLKEQTERHDGGNRWIGTGGSSPTGHGGSHPTGLRIGGVGTNRSALQIAGERRFRNLRSDCLLDTRQIGLALRRLRRLQRAEGPEELDIDLTIDKSAREGGEIELVFAPERRNRIKLLLLMDVGGSMDPHTALCERLFSAAHKANHFKKFRFQFFHNCIYEKLYDNMMLRTGLPTAELLRNVDETWSVIFVGDAWMSPTELTQVGGAIDYAHLNQETGLAWLQRWRQRCPNSVWLNPEPKQIWSAPTVHMIGQLFPMFELTIDGLTEATDMLRGARPNRPFRAT